MNELATKKVPTISLCGVDGVGKTSILRMLAEDRSLNNVCFVGRGPNDAESIVERYYPRAGNLEEWYKGLFNEAVAIACAIDYLAYHESAILPIISGVLANKFDAVVTDRHTSCFKAFALINEKPSKIALDILAAIEEPEYVIYFTLDREIIEARARQAREKFNEFESRVCQEKLINAYVKVFKDSKSKVFEVNNSGPLEETLAVVKNIINGIISSGS